MYVHGANHPVGWGWGPCGVGLGPMWDPLRSHRYCASELSKISDKREKYLSTRFHPPSGKCWPMGWKHSWTPKQLSRAQVATAEKPGAESYRYEVYTYLKLTERQHEINKWWTERKQAGTRLNQRINFCSFSHIFINAGCMTVSPLKSGSKAKNT